jgi:hypothetical protein
MSKLWWFRLPYGSAMDLRFRERVNEREARAYLRGILKVKRLPNGTEFWV